MRLKPHTYRVGDNLWFCTTHTRTCVGGTAELAYWNWWHGRNAI